MKKLLHILLLLILFLGCSRQEDKMRIGIIKPSLNHLPLDYVLHKDMFEDIEIVELKSGWETGEALTSGNVDLAILPFTYIWNAVAAGHDIISLSFLERESDGIIAQPEITDIKQLENKKIGVLKASTLDIIAEMVAEDEDINWDVVYFRTPMDLVSALKSKEVDAISYYIPPILKLEKEYNLIYWFGQSYPQHPCCDLAVRKDALKQYPDKIKLLQKHLTESCSHIDNGNDEIINLMVKNYSIDSVSAKKSLQHIKFSTSRESRFYTFEKRAFDKMIEKGYIKDIKSSDEIYREVYTP